MSSMRGRPLGRVPARQTSTYCYQVTAFQKCTGMLLTTPVVCQRDAQAAAAHKMTYALTAMPRRKPLCSTAVCSFGLQDVFLYPLMAAAAAATALSLTQVLVVEPVLAAPQCEHHGVLGQPRHHLCVVLAAGLGRVTPTNQEDVGQLTSLDGLKDSSCRTQRNTKVQRSAPHTVAGEWF